ncbi:MAG: PQQ-like beta-propeller repeat protein [Verrucomicrobia bacterium]|nr:PQQ-like beta-propeller repeat protein [Verrucomicrobiota bacterium]
MFTKRFFPFHARAVLSGVAIGFALSSPALDWPCFRGPDHNGMSKETGLATQWPASGPKQLWRATVGLGFSSVVVSDGRAAATGHAGDKDTVWCFDAATGSVLWSHPFAAPLGDKFFEGGCTGTPTFDGKFLYHLSREGDLFCFDAATGSIVWQKQLVKEEGFTKPEWGFASSPLVEGDLLIVNAGDAGTALDKATGKIVWTNGKGSGAYATAKPFELGGKRCVALFTYRECLALETRTGKVLWRAPFKSNYDTNAGMPVIHDGALEISAYNVPAVMLNLRDGKPVPAWKTDTRVHFNAGVVLDGSLFAFHGQAGKPDGELRCLDWKTGATKWAQKGLGVGSLTFADGKLIILSEKGELVLVEASAAGFKPLVRAQVLGGKCWAVPVLANGRLYCRNAPGDLVCLDVGSAAK